MIALVGALGHFHLPQQGIHLGNGQSAVSMDRSAASQRAQKLVGGPVEMVSVRIEVEVAHNSFYDLGNIFPREQRLNVADSNGIP